MINTYRILREHLKGRDHFEDLLVDWRIILIHSQEIGNEAVNEIQLAEHSV
jgi:hypothetical protein